MRVALIFPPATDPRAPHLGLPCLAAVLREAGIRTDLIDADIGGLTALLGAESVAASLARLRRGGARDGGAARLLARGEALVEAVPRALATLRDPERFYDVHAFHAARETILDALDLVSAAAPRPVRYDLCPIRYEVEGVDEQSLGDLIAVTADPDANLFEAHWRSDLFPALDADRPDLVGISIVNRQQILPGLTLARRLRARGLFVVLGGTVFTKFVSELLARPDFFAHFADGVIAYEGETAILELAAQLDGARDFAKVPNFLHVAEGRVRMGPTHVEDVDALPTPDFAGLPLAGYLAPAPVLPILVGKGCYFNACKFCDIPFINHVSRKPYRIRRPERIAQDILTLNARFGCRHFEFTDEALPPRLLDGVADALGAEAASRGLSFTGYARLEPGFTAPLCAKLARMGFRKLFFGLESGDQATLDHMRKGIRLENVRPVLGHCREAGIHFHVFSIIGFPEETEASARRTLGFFEDHADLIDHPGNSFDLHPFGLELRTRYFAEAEALGLGLPREALAKDFVIGLRGGWDNSRGLSEARVIDLVERYNTVLRRLFARFHNAPMHLWPGFEEYALLYASRYPEGAFPYRTALPEAGVPFRLTWNPAAALLRRDGRVQVASRWKAVELDERAFRALGAERVRTMQDLIRDCVAAGLVRPDDAPEERLRGALHDLIGHRLLQLVLAQPGPAESRADRRHASELCAMEPQAPEAELAGSTW
ncbi:B12-binding domain-containing radical SAM protein [Methylobacterium sp. WSM2598]|uniref:B12-binding domain-containing radical SAM protein n=1 Tax=Methylobacterium sp. WSM2598 TaxID=398261 RepID=UPI00037C115C|nr:radical SAM protein [Methylobacterium sp. WSM2598]